MRCRLASFNRKTGKIKLDPALNKKGRKRLKRGVQTHMKSFKHCIMPKSQGGRGMSFTSSIKEARRREHRGMSKKQVRIYEGKLGAIARWESKENR